MTTQEIVKRVQEKADARFGETIERLLLLLRQRHTHQCWKRECNCDYCRFINGEYVDAKLLLHKTKKRIRHYEYLYDLKWNEESHLINLEMWAARLKTQVCVFKQHKKDLQKEIL